MKNIYSLSKESLEKEAGRKRIRDRGIHWEEKYGEKTDDLKRRMDKKIGPGSYYRWEGHDYVTNSDYFVVVGPAITRYGQKGFFAGIKKLPIKEKRKKVYAPAGKYFPSIVSALSHAKQMWGTPFPPDQVNYDSDTLAPIDIPRKLKA